MVLFSLIVHFRTRSKYKYNNKREMSENNKTTPGMYDYSRNGKREYDGNRYLIYPKGGFTKFEVIRPLIEYMKSTPKSILWKSQNAASKIYYGDIDCRSIGVDSEEIKNLFPNQTQFSNLFTSWRRRPSSKSPPKEREGDLVPQTPKTNVSSSQEEWMYPPAGEKTTEGEDSTKPSKKEGASTTKTPKPKEDDDMEGVSPTFKALMQRTDKVIDNAAAASERRNEDAKLRHAADNQDHQKNTAMMGEMSQAYSARKQLKAKEEDRKKAEAEAEAEK